jgi:hypothetical protein
MEFSQKNLRIGGFEKHSFFKSAILKKKIFLLDPYQNQSQIM